MQTIFKEKTVKEILHYLAIDGTIFYHEEECRKYEESAKGVLRGRLKKITVAECNAWDLMGGYEDNEVLAVKVDSEKDADTLIQNVYFDNSYLLEEEHNNRKEEFEKEVQETLDNHDIYLLGINNDGDLYIIGARSRFISNLSNIGIQSNNVK